MIIIVNLGIPCLFQEHSRIRYRPYLDCWIEMIFHDERIFQPHEARNILVDENLDRGVSAVDTTGGFPWTIRKVTNPKKP